MKFLEDSGIYTVPKNLNPPNAPQVQPIENFWGALKDQVYKGNWSAKSRPSMSKCSKIYGSKSILPIRMGLTVS